MIEIFLINPKPFFYPIFCVCDQMQFQKILTKRFGEKFKNVDFGSKNVLFTLFGHNVPKKLIISQKLRISQKVISQSREDFTDRRTDR